MTSSIEICLMVQNMAFLVHIPRVLEKNVYSTTVGQRSTNKT